MRFTCIRCSTLRPRRFASNRMRDDVRQHFSGDWRFPAQLRLPAVDRYLPDDHRPGQRQQARVMGSDDARAAAPFEAAGAQE